jgi:16S rRNA U516 pseudouridylate synthase RsuA-like enzyme
MTEQTAKNIRNFFKIIGFHVTAVRCIRVGEFKLGVLSIGKWKNFEQHTRLMEHDF